MEEVEHIARAVFRLYFCLVLARLDFFYRVVCSWLGNRTFLTSETSNFFAFPLFFFFFFFFAFPTDRCIAFMHRVDVFSAVRGPSTKLY